MSSASFSKRRISTLGARPRRRPAARPARACRARSGARAGTSCASPTELIIHFSKAGDIACSRRSASSCTSSQAMPTTSVRNRSISRWRPTIASACSSPSSVNAQRLVLGARDVAVLLEPAQHLVDRRRRELHRARDVRAGDRQLRLHQPVDDLEVLLLGRCRVLCCHAVSVLARPGVCCAIPAPAIGPIPARSSRERLAASAARLAEEFAGRGCTVGLVARSADGARGGRGELSAGRRADVPARRRRTATRSRAPSRASSRRRAASTCWSPTPASPTTGRSATLPIEEAERMTRVNWLGTLYTVARRRCRTCSTARTGTS